jgi:putative ABC transport system substrate-binding protein
MKRRDFITLAGGATAWSVGASAQQPQAKRRIGVLSGLASQDPESNARHIALRKALADLGWTEERNIAIDYRWTEGDIDRERAIAAELVALAPDVILSEGSRSIGSLLRVTRTIPIVFVNVVDPVGSGYVASLSRPGGNATGFTQFEYRVSGKWLELLKEVAPSVAQVAVIRDSRIGAGIGQFAVIQAVAPAGVELFPVEPIASEIERAIEGLAGAQNGGVIVTAGTTGGQRNHIISLVAQHRLPAVYPFRYYTTAGGLISYGPSSIQPTRRAAVYIDRILKGEKPADMPVQAPTSYELVINLKTARSLGIDLPRPCSHARTRPSNNLRGCRPLARNGCRSAGAIARRGRP